MNCLRFPKTGRSGPRPGGEEAELRGGLSAEVSAARNGGAGAGVGAVAGPGAGDAVGVEGEVKGHAHPVART